MENEKRNGERKIERIQKIALIYKSKNKNRNNKKMSIAILSNITATL